MAVSDSVAKKHRKPAGAYHHGGLREALLTEALKLIEQRGPDQLSLRELARRLGVSSAAPYHHFANRTDLLKALALSGFECLERFMREDMEQVGDSPNEHLRALGRGYLRFAMQHPFQFRLMFRSDPLLQSHSHEHADDGAFGLLRDVVIACLKRAGRTEEDPMPSILAMWAGVHGIAALRLDGPLNKVVSSAEEVETLCQQALAVLGLALSAKGS
jgi:AcrR family transcriptional regulator